MSFNKEINKCIDLSVITYSKNGFPFFDIMLDSYVMSSNKVKMPMMKSSYVVFYSEEQSVIDKALELHGDIDAIKKFLKENKSSLYDLKDAKEKFGELNNIERVAFNNLNSIDSLKNTIEKLLLGSFHLILDNKVLVFSQEDIKVDFSKDCLIDVKGLSSIKKYLMDKYNSKQIEPVVILEQGAANKVIEVLQGSDLSVLNKKEKEMFQLFEDFKQISGLSFDTEIIKQNENTMLKFSVDEKSLVISLPNKQNKKFSILNDGAIFNNLEVHNVLESLGNLCIKAKIKKLTNK